LLRLVVRFTYLFKKITLILKRIFPLLFIMLSFSFLKAQQNQNFKDVKLFFDNHRQLLTSEFKKRVSLETTMENQNAVKNDFELFMSKLDSLENVALIDALVKTKNIEVLGKIKSPNLENSKTDFQQTDKTAEYPGGLDVLRTTIGSVFYDNSLYDQKTVKTNIRFVVERDGSVTNVVASGDNPSFNRQAEIAVYLLPEKFYPGSLNGNLVRSMFRLPLTMNFE
jgi:hypothetical protein